MNHPITELTTEHEAVRVALNVLGRFADESALSGRLEHRDELGELLEFFRIFLDRCHHGKEEKLLFPALEALGVGRNGGPIGVMLAEHAQGRDHVGVIRKALAAADDDGAAAAWRFVTSARAFIELLERHIEKENQVLFPLAAQRLSAEKLIELKQGFDRIEADEVGAGRHEAFHALLDRLDRDYLQRR